MRIAKVKRGGKQRRKKDGEEISKGGKEHWKEKKGRKEEIMEIK